MKVRQIWAALGAVCIGLSTASAQESTRELVIKSDNDAYLANGSDRYYTNGFFLAIRKINNRNETSDRVVKRISEFELGQKMYTSHSGYVWDRRLVDRAITAYLYVGASQTWYYATEKVLKLGIQVGTIGPHALGRQIQEIFHKITRTYAPNCWQYQLNNEIGLNTSMAYQDLLFRNSGRNLDLSWNGYLNVGNTFTGAGLGYNIRVGKFNRLFESTATRSVITDQSRTEKWNDSELFLFAKQQVDAVGYDASISGGLFIKEKGPFVFKPQPVVLNQEVGLMYSRRKFSTQASYIFKTREIKSAAVPDRYGSITTAFRF